MTFNDFKTFFSTNLKWVYRDKCDAVFKRQFTKFGKYRFCGCIPVYCIWVLVFCIWGLSAFGGSGRRFIIPCDVNYVRVRLYSYVLY